MNQFNLFCLNSRWSEYITTAEILPSRCSCWSKTHEQLPAMQFHQFLPGYPYISSDLHSPVTFLNGGRSTACLSLNSTCYRKVISQEFYGASLGHKYFHISDNVWTDRRCSLFKRQRFCNRQITIFYDIYTSVLEKAPVTWNSFYQNGITNIYYYYFGVLH